MMRILFMLAAMLFASSAMAVDANSPALHRGINLSSWFANAPRQPLTDRDFAQLHKAGFDHVRLPVNPELLGFSFEGGATENLGDFSRIDAAIAMARAHHLAVILDMHPRADFMKTLEEDTRAQAKFQALWVMLAQHYRAIPPSELVFELLNEPQYYTRSANYPNFAERLVKAIRIVDTTRLIIVAAPRGSSIEGLQQLRPIADANIAYDVHFYEPYMVTHQGIHQGFAKKMLRYFHDVPYPAALANDDAKTYAENASDADEAQQELDDYRAEDWDAERIAARVKLIRQWADTQHARVICGEFGVLRNHIDAASRYRWMHDVRIALDANNIGWDLWDYSDMFGIVTFAGDTITDPNDGSVRLRDPAHGARHIEPAALKSLGLPNKE